MSYTAAVSLGRALEMANVLDPHTVLKHNLLLADRLMAGLDALGATVLTPRDPDSRAGIVTAQFPGRDGEAIARQLTERKVIVSPRVGSTRFSLHHYNTANDVDVALNTLHDLLRTHR